TASPRALLFGELEARVGRGEAGGTERELDEPLHLLEALLLDPARAVPALHFTRDSRTEPGRVEPGDRAYSTLAGQERVPGFERPDADRRDETDARDDNAFHRYRTLSSRG